MRVAVFSIYILFIFLYFVLDYSKLTGAIFLIGQTSFIAFLCNQLESNAKNEIEKTVIKYVEYLSIANVAYIIICYIRGEEFAIYNTDIFAYILGISFVSLMVHIVYLKDKK